MKKNKISYADAYKMYASRGMWKNFFEIIAGYIIIAVGTGLLITTKGNGEDDFILFMLMNFIPSALYSFMTMANTPFDNVAGSRFFLTVRDRYDIYKKFNISSLVMSVVINIVTCSIGLFLIKFVFKSLDLGSGFYIAFMLAIILQRGLCNFLLIIKKPVTRGIWYTILSMLPMSLFIPIIVFKNENSVDLFSQSHIIMAVLAIVSIVLSEILLLKVYKKKFSLK